VQLEQIDFLDHRLSPRLFWMEGRGGNWTAIAEGVPEPRNPGDDNPLDWPRRYLFRLIHRFGGRRRPRSDFRLERAALFAWLHGSERIPPPPDWLVTRNARWPRPLSFALIAQTWTGLTSDWDAFGIPLMERDATTDEEWPTEVPDTLDWLPQSVLAWDEWRQLHAPGVEELDESTVRQHVPEVLRPA